MYSMKWTAPAALGTYPTIIRTQLACVFAVQTKPLPLETHKGSLREIVSA